MAAKKQAKKQVKKSVAKKKTAVKKAVKKAAVKKTAAKKPAAKKSAPKKSAAKTSIKDFTKFKDLLETIRLKVSGDLQQLEEDNLNKSQRDAAGDLSGYSFHMADVATDNFDLETNLGLASNEQNLLNLIDTALRKIDEGTYGICETCSKAIPQKRLMAMPYGSNCITCQEAEERERRFN